MRRALWITVAVAGALVAYMFAAGLLQPDRQGVVRLRVDDMPLQSVRTVREGRFHVVRSPDGYVAFSWFDPGGGCNVPWVASERAFHEPCRGAIYDISGRPVAGPAFRGLHRHPIEVRGGEAHVDTRRVIWGPGPRGEPEPPAVPVSISIDPAPASLKQRMARADSRIVARWPARWQLWGDAGLVPFRDLGAHVLPPGESLSDVVIGAQPGPWEPVWLVRVIAEGETPREYPRHWAAVHAQTGRLVAGR